MRYRAKKLPNEHNDMCCSGGEVELTLLNNPPEFIDCLSSGYQLLSEHYLSNSRMYYNTYNTFFQITSFGVKKIREGNFMSTFKVQKCQVYYQIDSRDYSLKMKTHNYCKFILFLKLIKFL